MKISYNWLKEFVSFTLSPQELAGKLTMLGFEVEELFKQEGEDYILDLKITPNRPDCLSHLGIAREIATVTGAKAFLPQNKVVEGNYKIEEVTEVLVEDSQACPRYSARVILGVKIAPSPDWLKRRIESVGLRPVNNVVDATNFVLMEMGHPLHAFDFNRLKERRIVVRRAKPNEKITTLDGLERNLSSPNRLGSSEEILVIADAEKPVALAGIMGGLESEVGETTEDILLESAYFNPTVIHRGSRFLQLKTEASYRFERGTILGNIPIALNRAAEMIRSLGGGKICQGYLDVFSNEPPLLELNLRPERINKILGIKLSREEVCQILERLGFTVTMHSAETPILEEILEVGIPSFRLDIKEEIDLIEEIARVHGYDKIESGFCLPVCQKTGGQKSEKEKIIAKVKEILNALGLTEVYTLSFMSPSAQKEFSNTFEAVTLKNPLSLEISTLRLRLLPNLLEILSYNQNHQISDVRIFELGKIYESKSEKRDFQERLSLAGVVSGLEKPHHWQDGIKTFDFFALKGLIQTFLTSIGVEIFQMRQANLEKLCSAKGITIWLNNNLLGYGGELNLSLYKEYDLKGPVFVFELDFEFLLKYISLKKEYKPLPKFLAIRRDLALLVPQTIESQKIVEIIQKTGKRKWIEKVELFDLYQGEQIPRGNKGLGFSIFYKAEDRTLTEEEVHSLEQEILTHLEEEIGAKRRAR
ncbi:MAG: phenylalanine--tRNA ligase subunit beta [Candidatus Edwardsbacteria bacterium]